MDFALAVDREACVTLSGARLSKAYVRIDDSVMRVDFGQLFHAEAPLSAIEAARTIPDPRPHTFLPMGVSAAVNTMGADTVSVIGSHEGLVEIDFTQPVTGAVPPPGETPNSRPEDTGGTIQFRHLVVSLEDPNAFVHMLEDQKRDVPAANAAVSAS